MKIALTVFVASLALAPAASAQLPTPPPAQPPAPQPAPEPADAKLSVSVAGGMKYKKTTYVVAGERITARGRIKPVVSGEKVVVELLGRGRVVADHTVTPGKDGKFSAVFRPGRAGVFAVRARHERSDAQKAARSSKVRFAAVRGKAGSGASGTRVRLLQRGLARLGFVTSRSGSFDDATGRAVLAFRKTNGLGRRSAASREVFKRVFAGRGAFRLRYPQAGKHVEFDWSRQVLVLAEKGRPVRVYHASSGKASTPTVFGTFRFYRKQPGTNSKGMVHSNYFIRGYAIHGYESVPTYPASHGCIRVPIPNALSIDRWIDIGDRIFVYR